MALVIHRFKLFIEIPFEAENAFISICSRHISIEEMSCLDSAHVTLEIVMAPNVSSVSMISAMHTTYRRKFQKNDLSL